MRRRLLAIMLLLTVTILPWPAMTMAAPAEAPLASDATAAATSPIDLDAEERAFLNLINQYRRSRGIAPLAVNRSLSAAAVWHSNDMATKNYFSHTDSLRRDPFKRMAAFGYGFNTWKGENIAAGYPTAAAVFEAWKRSSGHNQNMLNRNFKVIGIGRVVRPGSRYTTYWTTDFGGR